MTKCIIACIDGSLNADPVCNMAAWVAQRTKLNVSLLHVLPDHISLEVQDYDHTGTIGIFARASLMEELTMLDEEQGKLDQRKGHVLLQHGKEVLMAAGVDTHDIIYRRGDFIETLAELEDTAELIIMGRRGESHADRFADAIGDNLEPVARTLHLPVFIVPRESRSIKQFVVAYDGSASAQKALDYVLHQPLFKGLICHLVHVGHDTGEAKASMQAAETALLDAGYETTTKFVFADSVDEGISTYISEHPVDVLVMGGFGHHRLLSFIFGSKTSALMHATSIPMLLFR